MRSLASSSLVTRSVCFACIIGLSGFLAFEGYDKTADQAKWFIWNNVIGAIGLFLLVLMWNLFLAPGRLLSHEIGREVFGQWLSTINIKISEANGLIEAIKLKQDLSISRQQFETWRDETRCFFRKNIPIYEPIFDDIEMGPYGPLLDLPARMRASSSVGFQNYMNAIPEDPSETLIDLISRRRGNLQRIYERLAPMSLSGNPRDVLL